MWTLCAASPPAVFTLLPAGVLFRLHQFIVYGGTFGEYQMYGLERYVRSFLLGHYLPVALGSLLAACIYRVLAEPVGAVPGWPHPSSADAAA